MISLVEETAVERREIINAGRMWLTEVIDGQQASPQQVFVKEMPL